MEYPCPERSRGNSTLYLRGMGCGPSIYRRNSDTLAASYWFWCVYSCSLVLCVTLVNCPDPTTEMIPKLPWHKCMPAPVLAISGEGNFGIGVF